MYREQKSTRRQNLTHLDEEAGLTRVRVLQLKGNVPKVQHNREDKHHVVQILEESGKPMRFCLFCVCAAVNICARMCSILLKEYFYVHMFASGLNFIKCYGTLQRGECSRLDKHLSRKSTDLLSEADIGHGFPQRLQALRRWQGYFLQGLRA